MESALAVTGTAPVRTRRSPRSARKVLLGALGLVGFLVTWQLIPALGVVSPRFLPYASDVLGQILTEVRDLEFWRNVGRTLTAWGLGLLIATLLAVVAGALIGLVPFLRRATHTTVEFLRPIPSVALIPLAILVFGLQLQAALLIIVYATFWQVFVQVLYGVADVDSVARDTAKSFGLSRAERFRYLVLPTALPYIMTGLRLGAAVALILAITAELVIGIPGIGREIVFAQTAGDWTTVYAYVVVAGLLGLTVNLIFRFIERHALSWHQSVRGEEVL
ncbi:putative aliphatic sulfonates transport permease protein SsuC [Microbacterium hydrocarbonoxydans]|uniref:Putative aliphatic sulfonates transport permease protein SsuC n=1 Tax=Microbacterium hydrocarbonoxydans TaxID=273678 RepID=A0A0M2HKV9_9MICO|nr:ABC transporter permease [Microbacterium hydrocarbonoxydans]KJL47321.1 putative aliphatic sulfonates transport permease protein SsuC [Microbacterium hydrocarbonoxydans]